MNESPPVRLPASASISSLQRAAAFLLTACCFAVIGRSLLAQSSSGGPRVIVLVQPFGASTQVVATYDGFVEADLAKGDLARLASETGGKLSQIDVTIQKSQSGVVRGKIYHLGTITVASAMLTGARLVNEEAFTMTPFVRAFARSGEFEVFWFTPRLPRFRGLRAFDNGEMQVWLVQEGGPYRYRVSLNPGTIVQTALPRYDVSQSAGALNAPASVPVPKSARPAARSFLPVVVLAAASGLLTLSILLVRTWLLRAKRPGAPFPVRRPEGRAIVFRSGSQTEPKRSLEP